jgi:hypothetical protein
MRSPRSLALALVMLAAVSSTSCFDPEHRDEVDALGGETNGVGPGPLHRPGQPCRACHGGMGPGKPEFPIAGTVYANRDKGAVKEGVMVTITDVTGDTRTLTSNQAGNFYISIDDWSPTFPVNPKLAFPGLDPKTQTQMQTPIGRNGGCGFCHYGPDNEPTHMPPVYLEN